MKIVSRFLRLGVSLGAVFLLGGLLGAALVRYAPGFEADERLLSPELGESTRQAIGAERAAGRDVGAFYWAHLRGMLAGDLGQSQTLQVPVRDLLASRLPVTVQLAGYGLLAGWAAGLVAAGAGGLLRLRIPAAIASAAAALSTSIPVALTAFAVLYWDLPVWLCVAGAIFPRVYRYTGNAIEEQWTGMAVMAAIARGVPRMRAAVRHVVVPVIPRTLALAGVTVSAAIGASIPVEVLADVPGLGQLVWKAAAGRDLPVLVSLTMLVTAVTLAANAIADAGVAWFDRSAV